tara:strand:- start:319 stop:507 length:189 start_codon:yes stop_codon:yes gene_type:complete
MFEPIFFDHLGFPAFIFLVIYSYKDLKDTEMKRPLWTRWVFFIISLFGMAFDGFNLFRYYFI